MHTSPLHYTAGHGVATAANAACPVPDTDTSTTLHYAMLHYTTLHFTTLRYTAPQYHNTASCFHAREDDGCARRVFPVWVELAQTEKQRDVGVTTCGTVGGPTVAKKI